MTVMILYFLLLAVGVPLWADKLPVKHHGKSELTVTSTDQLLEKTIQDESNIPNERASAVLADQLPVKTEEHLMKEDFDKVASGCEYPFEPVGNNCYFFSDDKRNFDGAINYCETLGHGYDVTLAMLEVDEDDDQALLVAAMVKDKTFWVGGKSEDGVHFEWQDGRDIYLQAPIWQIDEPNEAQNKCMVAQVTTWSNMKRSYLYDYDCGESMNFICQIGCPFEFRRIGKYCYFLSEEEGAAHLSWPDARDYCQSLAVPVGYHADLAVLGLPDQESYFLMNSFVAGYTVGTYTWLGGFEETDCDFKWIDGRSFPLTSTYWIFNEPDCGGHHSLVLRNDVGRNRTYIRDSSETPSYPFICQMFKD